MKKKILMLATGGTIASKQTTAGMIPELSSEDILLHIPQVSEICEVSTYQVCNIDSTNMTPEHWMLMSKTIEKYYDQYDGFVICHGTDTLAYTAAALSYMVQHSPKPIVITGAQRPIDTDVTDAKTNLLDSFIYAIDPDSQDVNIVFDGKVIIGTRAKKVRAKSYNAFESINFPYTAVIQDQKLIRYLTPGQKAKEPEFFHEMKKSVCLLKLNPGIKPEMLSFVFDHHDGIIIESFGVGGIPENILEEFYYQMEKCDQQNKCVVMATQVANEGSNMTIYEVGKRVKKELDLMEAYDMTLEATIAKLMWLMSRPGMNPERIRSEFYRKINHDILYKL